MGFAWEVGRHPGASASRGVYLQRCLHPGDLPPGGLRGMHWRGLYSGVGQTPPPESEKRAVRTSWNAFLF